nr:unnamed protein product [Callosobruchus chinensis]
MGRYMSSPAPGEEVVISGIAGEFPGSKNVHELLKNLHNKENLMKAPQRWDYYNPDIPPSGGQLSNELGNFDAGFFAWHEKLADNSDSLVRHPVEKAIEAVIDAGLHPGDMQNQRCGIFVGACFSESERNAYLVNVQPEFPMIGYLRSQIAHRIGYYLKTKGPAMITDTACSSSMIAFENAFSAMRSGVIDCAIVAGVNFCLNPMATLQFSWMGVLSKNATCSPFSKDGNGYVRSETVGTMVGDPVECEAIDKAIMTHRKEPLLIGSVKSNIGHTEPASGLPSIAKVIDAMETGMIAPNINLGELNPSIPALIEVTKSGEIDRKIGYLRKHTPLYFAFGDFTNWFDVSNKLMQLLPFADSMQRSQKHLSKKINLSEFSNRSKFHQYQVIGNVAAQIGIIDLFNAIKMKPNNYYGYSYGELLALYIDGKLTREQVLDCAISVNNIVNETEALGNANVRMVNGNGVTNSNGYYGSTVEDLKTALRSNKTRSQLLQDFSTTISSKNFVVDSLIATLSGSVPVGIQKIQPDSKLITFGWIPSPCIPEDVILSTYNPTTSQNIVDDMLKLLGNLYIAGYDAEFDKLYPFVEFPVSRSTRMISPYLKWKHDRKYFVPLYSNYTEKGVLGIRNVIISPIDLENLFPATGYLYLVWQTLALMKGEEMSTMDVIFDDCRFHQATQLPSKGHLSFFVTIHGSGKFEVVESNVTVVTGRIEMTAIRGAQIGHNDFCLNSAMKMPDIYKELKLRGYNYTGGFRLMQDFDLRNNRGHIKWNDNWVTFMDNMLQMKMLASDTRLLYVPTCGHIKIQGLMSSAITRKRDMRVPVLEKYVFVPNEAYLKIEESVRVNIQIILENTLSTKVKCVEVVDQFTTNNSPLSPIVLSVLEDQPLIQPNVTILSKTAIEGISIPTVDKTLKTETDCTMIVVSKLSQKPEFLQDIFESLKENGFIISREELNYDASKVSFNGLDIFTIHKTDVETLLFYSTFPWIKELQEMSKTKSKEDIVLYNEKDSTSGILGLVNCLRREPETRNVRCLFYMDESDTFDINDPDLQKQLKKKMAINVKKYGKWGTYRHMLIKRETYAEVEHCVANTMVKGDLTSLRWTEGPLTSNAPLPSEKDLIRVCYSSLNFRDVMLASGKLNVDIVKSRLEQECVLGIEYAGIDHRGNRVMGLATAGAISTMVVCDTYLSWKVPERMSLEEAATIPTVYGTLAYGLLYKGKMKQGDSILIHSGTGGIGLAAIRMAIHYGVTIFVTVGTKEKKEYLLKRFPQIKANSIGNSRDISFEQMVMTQTKGRGVDMVINSLAEEKLTASVRCLAKGGRFIEIGKFDLTKNSELSVALDMLLFSTPPEKRIVGQYMNALLNEGVIKPFDRTVFKMNETEQAFRYMMTGKHIGKVILQIREPRNNNIVEKKMFTALTRYNCCADKCYIILGGLGGFGLELADWMVVRGCRKLVLTSRKGVTTGYQANRIKTWKSYGVDVHISTANVTLKEGCMQLIKEAQRIGPIESIFNLAVILQDAIFENQTSDAFNTSFGPKARATRYLDEISREMCPDLKDFVVFSSVSCGRGNAGQTNYGMANSIMERICENRKKDGYPALAVEWGAIGEEYLCSGSMHYTTSVTQILSILKAIVIHNFGY